MSKAAEQQSDELLKACDELLAPALAPRSPSAAIEQRQASAAGWYGQVFAAEIQLLSHSCDERRDAEGEELKGGFNAIDVMHYSCSGP